MPNPEPKTPESLPLTPISTKRRPEAALAPPKEPKERSPKGREMRFRLLSEIEPMETRFLWRPYIPLGAVTLLFGYGGMGKSWISCSIAADVSAGRALPGATAPMPPQRVLIVSAEDDPNRIMRPRMEALGADMSKIMVSDHAFQLNHGNMEALIATMAEFAATIVVLDPLVSFLGPDMDMNRSNESRAMMGPLAEAAKRTDSAVIVVHHSKKDGSGRSANRAMGSADFINSVRSALMVDEDKSGTHFMRHVKHNWSAEGPAQQYAIHNDVFQWEGTHNPETIVKTPKLLGKAKELIFDLLRDGPLSVADLTARAADAGVSYRTLMRAKDGVATSYKLNGPKGGWMWELCGSQGTRPEQVAPAVVAAQPTKKTMIQAPGGPTVELKLKPLLPRKQPDNELPPEVLAMARARLLKPLQ